MTVSAPKYVFIVAGVVLAVRASAQPALPPAPNGVEVTRTYGIEFSTVDHPGNPGYMGPWNTPEVHPPRGGVEYEYRISRTEITIGQWFEFVQAYQPYFHGTPNERAALQAGWINYDHATNAYSYHPFFENFAAVPSWNDAARFCNWLQNGKVQAAWAFENGVYNISTLSTADGQPIRDQATRSPGARYWIPSQDEWLKAVYWDPNKDGSGQGGYWAYPNGSDQIPVSGPPDRLGATTNASAFPGDDGTWSPIMPVAQYIASQSPWGLFDTSGGETEWTEAIQSNRAASRLGMGAGRGGQSWLLDAIATTSTTYYEPLSSYPLSDAGSPWLGGFGLRLASRVPGASSAASVCLIGLMISKRRRLRYA